MPTEKVLQQSRDFEVSLSEMSRRSERRAWMVAGASLAMSLLLGVGYLFVMPLKEQVPYLVLADPYRGTSTVARIEALNPVYTANEFLNKSNVANFVIARESYDWDITSRRDRRMVYSMATGSALAEYRALYAEGGAENPDKVYGPNASLRIRILSIVLQGGSQEKPPSAATVRFERWVFNRVSGQSKFLDTRIASLKIGYDRNLQMAEEGRYLNPLGFRVYAYRTDPDSFGEATSAQPPAAAVTPGAGGAAAVAVPAQPAARTTQPAMPAMPDLPATPAAQTRTSGKS